MAEKHFQMVGCGFRGDFSHVLGGFLFSELSFGDRNCQDVTISRFLLILDFGRQFCWAWQSCSDYVQLVVVWVKNAKKSLCFYKL